MKRQTQETQMRLNHVVPKKKKTIPFLGIIEQGKPSSPCNHKSGK